MALSVSALRQILEPGLRGYFEEQYWSMFLGDLVKQAVILREELRRDLRAGVGQIS